MPHGRSAPDSIVARSRRDRSVRRLQKNETEDVSVLITRTVRACYEAHGDVISSPAIAPGIQIDRGTLIVDESQLEWSGDLLHEAGHLAILLPEHRMVVTGTAGEDPGFDMAAIAGSWAALVHLRLDPPVVFYEEGFGGGSQSLIEKFSMGRFVGVPMLRWKGMITDEDEFPVMSRWLRE